jgi:transposase-like protein
MAKSSDLLSRWREQFLERVHQVFADPATRSAEQARIAELERLVGQLTFELAAAKKLSTLLSSPSTRNER